MSSVKQCRAGSHHWLMDTEILPDCGPAHFDIGFWHGNITGQSHGRGTTYFVSHQEHRLVLRHYRRGGLVGKLLDDQYFFTGLKNSRPFQEFRLLNWMHNQGLPVPRPVAAHVQRCGLIYRADLIQQQIENAQDLHQLLCQQSLSEQQWFDVGCAIASLHNLQIYHHDLNIHNLMMDSQNRIWLIDFDRCQRRSGSAWKAQNLARLKRSLSKERQTSPGYFWQEQEWHALQRGYQHSEHIK
ncbi:3-deoxy-D-manno-octulosonic acid kinase [Bowmanella denitrificans]|uniref:3-deoxy-D-manno-octulosonic acid kinase n=1 Tax=Bowmanella denitrificans TaxID=366582 RepID=UPI0015583D51|nr:3-deoxy-D-manno-octulosonic acid kinase [Bowmanella denitrificans]